MPGLQNTSAARVFERRARTDALLHAIPDLMLRLHRDGTYLDFAGATWLLANPPETLEGRNVYDLLPPEAHLPLMRCVHSALATGELETTEYGLRSRDGVYRDFEVRVVVSGEDEVLVIVRDVSEQKDAERELRRLRDELEASLAELRRSRARLVDAADAERRRLERNLHDGAQQRLVSVSHFLRLARRRVDDPGATAELLSTAEEQLTAAHEELRELARGIHPVTLTERGLAAAVEGLASRAAVPVRIESLPAVRLPAPVEAAAYYVVAEALANATKYAQATEVVVRAEHDGELLRLEIADDGVGGADPAGGTGLRGLSDRVEALDGVLALASEPGAGTSLRAEFPLSS
jgi:PAS domain S-box-containing protein